MSRLGPIERLGAAPGDALKTLRMVPEIVENTRTIAAHTALLAEVSEKLDVLQTMDSRMATIEEAMPVLVEVQRHLAQLPETMDRLDEALDRLSGLMEQILAALAAVGTSVDTLQSAVEPMGRLANRVPGQRKSERD